MVRQHTVKHLDVPYVDGALLSILVPRIHGYLRDCSLHFPSLSSTLSGSTAAAAAALNESDIHNLIQCTLSALMALATIGRGVGSPAMNALGLKMEPATDDGRIQRVVTYVVLSGVLPTLYQMVRNRWEDDRETAHIANEDISRQQRSMERIASDRRRKVRDAVMKFIAFVVPPARLINHLCFLLAGSGGSSCGESIQGNGPASIPPTLSMRIAGLSYSSSVDVGGQQQQRQRPYSQQHINYAYAYRRVLYEQMFSLAQIMAPAGRHLSAVPLSVVNRVRRLRQRLYSYMLEMSQRSSSRRRQGQLATDESSTSSNSRPCSICGADPINVPYKSSSGDFHCYYCIRSELLDKPEERCRSVRN